MKTLTYPDVLQMARQLPTQDRLQLAQTLLTEVSPQPTLRPLIGLKRAELQTLAESIVSPDRQEQLQTLLAKNQESNLNEAEQRQLDRLLAEVDQVALLKARAMYTLQQYDQAAS